MTVRRLTGRAVVLIFVLVAAGVVATLLVLSVVARVLAWTLGLLVGSGFLPVVLLALGTVAVYAYAMRVFQALAVHASTGTATFGEAIRHASVSGVGGSRLDWDGDIRGSYTPCECFRRWRFTGGQPVKKVLHGLANRAATGLLGSRIGVYNGVAVPDRAIFDANDHRPDYKCELVSAVRDAVETGDRVSLVGGGRSVAAVHAARVGGEVTVIEAGREAARLSSHVAALNGTHFAVEYAVVGEAGAVAGEVSGFTIDPGDLSGDVLVLDCEGAETDILPVDGFETVIVETHPEHGAPADAVIRDLDAAQVVGPDAINGEVVVGE